MPFTSLSICHATGDVVYRRKCIPYLISITPDLVKGKNCPITADLKTGCIDQRDSAFKPHDLPILQFTFLLSSKGRML